MPSALPARPSRRRDRRGRGMRGPLMPQHLPGYRTRNDRFDIAVLDAVRTLADSGVAGLEQMEFAVESVPPRDPEVWEPQQVTLGRFYPAVRGRAARVVVYRRTIQTRCADQAELDDLVRHVVIEQVAAGLGVRPRDLDPRFEDD